ncbi:MAG: TolC family protein, partial [Gemmatimonadaceae bacterium]
MKASKSNRWTSTLRFLAAGVIFASPVLAHAQVATPVAPVTNLQVSGTALSLDDAVKLAEGQSEAVSIARAGVQRTEGQLLQARSQYFPQINGSGSYTRTLKSQYSGFGGSSPADTTIKVVSPAGPCDAYLKDATASTADRLFGLEQSSRCALGLNPFASLRSL